MSVPPHPVIAPVLMAVTVPEMRQVPLAAFVKLMVGTAGIAPHATVTSAGDVIKDAGAAGVTVIVLVTGVSDLPHASVAVQVSVIVPPQGPGAAERVDVLDIPVIRHDPLNPFV